jgi:hypothetical protein
MEVRRTGWKQGPLGGAVGAVKEFTHLGAFVLGCVASAKQPSRLLLWAARQVGAVILGFLAPSQHGKVDTTEHGQRAGRSPLLKRQRRYRQRHDNVTRDLFH